MTFDWQLAWDLLCLSLEVGTLVSVFVGVVATYWDEWDQT